MKEIANIIIYNSIEDNQQVRKACIFYDDGTSKTVDYYDEGIDAIKEVLKREYITRPEQLKEMMNKEYFFTMSEEEFNSRYEDFLNNSKHNKYSEEEDEILETLQYNGESHYESFDSEIEDEELEEEEEEVQEEKDENAISFLISKDYTPHEKMVIIKEAFKADDYKGLKIIGGLVLGTALVAGTAFVCTYCSKKGTMKPANTKVLSTTDITTDEPAYPNVDDYTYVLSNNDNDLYNDYTFAQLLEVTNNEFQKSAMINASSALTGFNSVFAKNYIESGHDIRAALSFDEVVALQQAYNDYTIDEVRAYFNGYEVDAVEMSNNYKSASMQLMGAYVIETKENPVDMSILIDSQEGRDFYNRYHEMFLAAKYAEGDEQLRLVKEFYDAVREDFPITEEVRTEGISHSEDHSELKDYQLSVIPMIDAAERIFQNLEVDYTLGNESEELSNYDFMNDLGLCNHVDDKFERLETIMLGSYEDNTNPLYEQYRNAIIAELVNSNEYVIDDAHRELTELRRFQEVINNDPLWKHRNGVYNGEVETTYVDEETTYWTDTKTVEVTETTTEVAEIPSDEQQVVDDQIAAENEQARAEAEQAAEAERARQQAEEDQNAKDIEAEIEAEEEQLQEDINNANDTINNNNSDDNKSNDTPVNESDFTGNVDFDDNHSNSNGDLDSSVENITTDGTGADLDLPDPNETGKDFDSRSTTTRSTSYTESVYSEEVAEGVYIEYDQEYTKYDEDGNPVKSKVRQLTKRKLI